MDFQKICSGGRFQNGLESFQNYLQKTMENDMEPSKVDAFNSVLNGYNVKALCVCDSSVEHFDILNVKLLQGCKIRDIEGILREIQINMQLASTPILVSDAINGIVKIVAAKENKNSIDYIDLLKQPSKSIFDCKIGYDMFGGVLKLDITKAPHLLVAGATGSGKSVFLNVLIANIISMGNDALLTLCDPKFVEFGKFKELSKSNIFGVYHEYEDILSVLRKVYAVMELRFKEMSAIGCRNIDEYNMALSKKNIKHKKWFVMIDEIADLMSKDKSKKFHDAVCSLAAKSRAAGIHLILATQRPSVDIVSGLIKANFPTRVVFKVSSSTDSRVIIDQNGAENLLSHGDGILYGYDGKDIIRFKSAYISQNDIFALAMGLNKTA